MFRVITTCPICHSEQIAEKATVTVMNVIYDLPCGHTRALPIKRGEHKLTKGLIVYKLNLIDRALTIGIPLYMDGHYFNAIETIQAKYNLEQMLKNSDYVDGEDYMEGHGQG